MKIPFTLEAWLADKSQRIETRDGRPARIICTDAKADDGACIIALISDDGGEESYQFFPDGRAFSSKSSIEDCADLFIITPVPELSEIEVHLLSWLSDDTRGEIPMERMKELVRNRAAELLDLARKELVDDMQLQFDDEINEAYYQGRKEGKDEALKDLPRWRTWKNGTCGNSEGHPIALVASYGGLRFVSVFGATGEKYIMLSDLEKLPKEDE